MRIIAGTKRGMKLHSPPGYGSRPIIDRVKEALFSVLYKYDLPAGAMVADLFSGVGSLGLEALSRGAEFVSFVEQDPKTIVVLEKNIAKAGVVKESKVVRANAFKLGAPVGSDGRMYGLVFVDPPYAATEDVGPDSALGRLFGILSQQVMPGGIVVVRTSERTTVLDEYDTFVVLERRRLGTMAIVLHKRRADDE